MDAISLCRGMGSIASEAGGLSESAKRVSVDATGNPIVRVGRLLLQPVRDGEAVYAAELSCVGCDECVSSCDGLGRDQ